jgi:hypothetical protein
MAAAADKSSLPPPPMRCQTTPLASPLNTPQLPRDDCHATQNQDRTTITSKHPLALVRHRVIIEGFSGLELGLEPVGLLNRLGARNRGLQRAGKKFSVWVQNSTNLLQSSSRWRAKPW